MAYSAGFTPHPRVSYANAASTGTGSEAEYLEIALAEPRDPEELRRLLDASMPDGLDIVEAVEARTTGFADQLAASHWELRLPKVEHAEAERAVRAFLAADRVEVRRAMKKGIRTFDARAAVVSLEVVAEPISASEGAPGAGGEAGVTRPTQRDGAGQNGGSHGLTPAPCAILRLVVRHHTPAVRPDDVLSGLRATADLAPPVPAAVTRLAQGPLDEVAGTVTDPFAPDRDAVTAATPKAAGQQAAAASEATN